MSNGKTKLDEVISALVKEVIKENIVVNKKQATSEEMVGFLRALASVLPENTYQEWILREGSFSGIITNSSVELADAIEKYSMKDPEATYEVVSVRLQDFDGGYSREAREYEKSLTNDIANLDLDGVGSNPSIDYINSVTIDAISAMSGEAGDRMKNAVYPKGY